MLSAVTLPNLSSLSTIVGNVANQQGYPPGNPSVGSGSIGDLLTKTTADVIAKATETPAPKPKSNWKWWALGIGGVVLVGGGLYVATRKRRR